MITPAATWSHARWPAELGDHGPPRQPMHGTRPSQGAAGAAGVDAVHASPRLQAHCHRPRGVLHGRPWCALRSSPGCPRGVVVQITVSERVEAWRAAGGDYHEIVDNLRLDIAIGIRAPSHIPSSDLAAVNLDFMELEACSLGSCVQTWLPTAALCTDAGVRVRVFVAASRHFNDCVCVAITSSLSKACSWRHYLTWWCWIYERTKCVANCSVLTLLCLPQVPPEH